MRRKRAFAAILMTMMLGVTSIQPVYAADKEETFAGWDDSNKEDAWSVYSGTDWSVYSKELNFELANSKTSAINLSSEVEGLRERVSTILGKTESYLGVYANEEYTELILAIIQVVSNGNPDENDPAQVRKYINTKIPLQSMSFDKSITTLMQRIHECETAHESLPSIYENNEKLQSLIQGVVFSPKYTKENQEYTLDNAAAFKEENQSKIHGNPSADFAQKVTEHYSVLKVSGGSSSGTGDIVISGNGILAHPCPESTISSPYGWREFDGSFHKGIDLAAPEGTPTYAAESGTVWIAGWSDSAGNWIVINHDNGLCTIYMHHSQLFVSAGQRVVKGQHIGAVGNTGNSFGAHLHFEVKQGDYNGPNMDPINFL